MKITFKNKIITLLFSSLFFFSSSVTAWFEDDEGFLWKAGLNQYIKYADQDSSKFGRNEHPVELNDKKIANGLKALEYEGKSLLSSETIETVFSSLQVKVLSQALSKGLKSAKPEQDIIFVLVRVKDQLLGLKERTFLAGRAFYKEGKLNIIIGDYDFFKSKAFESAYDPGGQSAVPYTFNFGKRTKKSRAFKDTHISALGIENKELAGLRRRDWIVIDVPVASKAYVNRENERENPVTKYDKQLEIEAAKLAKQRREMRVEMARMRKEVQAVSEGSTSAKTIEERMVTLKKLLTDKLITQEEYDNKRQDILNDI